MLAQAAHELDQSVLLASRMVSRVDLVMTSSGVLAAVAIRKTLDGMFMGGHACVVLFKHLVKRMSTNILKQVDTAMLQAAHGVQLSLQGVTETFRAYTSLDSSGP